MPEHPDIAAMTPVAIGGVGGSGTRLIAQLLMELGFFMGSDLNESNDNLWFTLLFKRPGMLSVADDEFDALLRIFVARMTGSAALSEAQAALVNRLAAADRPQHPADWLKLRAASLLSGGPLQAAGPWGWKEPNTHIVVDRLQQAMPQIRYVHVVRNGLDMAHSANQNQLRLWGAHFIGPGFEVTPYYSLKYWHAVHRRVLRLCEPMGARFLLLNYDRFCVHPEDGMRQLLDFMELQITPSEISRLVRLVRPPASMGRFREHGIDIFDPADVAFVGQLGFDVRPE